MVITLKDITIVIIKILLDGTRTAFLVLMSILYSTSVISQDTNTDTVTTNFDIIKNLSEKITNKIIDNTNLKYGDSLSIRYNADDDMWIVHNTINEKLNSLGYHVFLKDTLSTTQKIYMDILSSDLSVKYNKMFRDGFLGAKKIHRIIGVSLSCQVVNTIFNNILFSGTLSELSNDTIKVDDIEKAEYPSTKVTHAELPDETFMDKIIEPLIIIGATGVAIYLLFHVRS